MRTENVTLPHTHTQTHTHTHTLFVHVVTTPRYYFSTHTHTHTHNTILFFHISCCTFITLNLFFYSSSHTHMHTHTLSLSLNPSNLHSLYRSRIFVIFSCGFFNICLTFFVMFMFKIIIIIIRSIPAAASLFLDRFCSRTVTPCTFV